MLRKVQVEEAQQGRTTKKEYQLHPKLKQELEQKQGQKIQDKQDSAD